MMPQYASLCPLKSEARFDTFAAYIV